MNRETIIRTLRRLLRVRFVLTWDERISDLEALPAQLDLLRSSLEIPDEWIDEFYEWKQNHPIPEKPLVSICIRTYNRSALLMERALPSALKQTYPHFEVIVVGDCCTDDTEQQMAQVRDSRVTFVNLPQRTRYPSNPERRYPVIGMAPFNKALSMTTGDFVTHLDDDDEFFPERLERLIPYMRERDLDFAWHPFWQEDPSGRWRLNRAREFRFGHLTTSSVLYRSWFKRVELTMSASRLMEIGDWHVYRKIRYIGAATGRYPEPLIRHYRERASRLDDY